MAFAQSMKTPNNNSMEKNCDKCRKEKCEDNCGFCRYIRETGNHVPTSRCHGNCSSSKKFEEIAEKILPQQCDSCLHPNGGCDFSDERKAIDDALAAAEQRGEEKALRQCIELIEPVLKKYADDVRDTTHPLTLGEVKDRIVKALQSLTKK